MRRGLASLLLAIGAVTILAGPALAAPPGNDDFLAATVLTGTPVDLAGQTNLAATGQAGEPDHAASSLRTDCGGANTRLDGTIDPGCLPSVWYAWTPVVTLDVTINTCDPTPGPGSLANSTLAVYTGGTVDALTQVAANDDASSPAAGCSPASSRVTFRAVAGTTYEIAVAGFHAATGNFSLHLFEQPPPANDDFASATALSGDSIALAGQTNAGATGEAGEPTHAGASLAEGCLSATDPDRTCLPSVWYSWRASRTFIVTIDTCAPLPDYDTTLAVYTGIAVNGLTIVASNDEAAIRPSNAGCDPPASRVTFRAIAGTTYRIAVAGFVAAMGSFPLHILQQPPPVNDDFSAAAPLSGESADVGGLTLAATGEPGEPDHAGASVRSGCSDATTPDVTCISSVWYSWSSPSAAVVTVDLCDAATTTDTTLAVYTGSSVGALSPVAANDDASPACASGQPAFASRLTFTAAAGTVYRIAVADFARQGPFVLRLLAAPAPAVAAAAGGQSAPGAAPGVTPEPGPGVADTTAPVVTGFGLTRRTFTTARGPTPLVGSAAAVRHGRGSAFRFRLSEAALARISIGRVRAGRRRAGRCVAASRRLRRAKRCARVVTQGVLKRESRRGANRVVFTGRIGTHALRPGRYRATLTAADAAGNRGTNRTITFTITRR